MSRLLELAHPIVADECAAVLQVKHLEIVAARPSIRSEAHQLSRILKTTEHVHARSQVKAPDGMASSSRMHRIALDARAPLGKIFDHRRKLIIRELVVTIFLEVQVFEVSRWSLQGDSLGDVDAVVHTVSAAVDRQNIHLVEWCSSDCTVSMSEVMRDRYHRNVLVE